MSTEVAIRFQEAWNQMAYIQPAEIDMAASAPQIRNSFSMASGAIPPSIQATLDAPDPIMVPSQTGLDEITKAAHQNNVINGIGMTGDMVNSAPQIKYAGPKSDISTACKSLSDTIGETTGALFGALGSKAEPALEIEELQMKMQPGMRPMMAPSAPGGLF